MWLLADGDQEGAQPNTDFLRNHDAVIVLASSPRYLENRKWARARTDLALELVMRTWQMEELLVAGYVFQRKQIAIGTQMSLSGTFSLLRTCRPVVC
jgi:hypothetical protein